MKCEVVQNRLLALPDSHRVPDDLRAHVTTCTGCTAFLATAARLDGLLAALPVPQSSADVKAAFLERVTEAGPVIKRIPTIPRPDSTIDLRAVLMKNGRWKYAGALAASLLIGAGVWVAVGGKRAPGQPETVALKHELLNREVKHFDELANATTPPERIAVWSAVAADLRGEAKALYVAAQEPEMRALARMYEKAVREGVVAQAELLSPAPMPTAEKREALTEAANRLTEAEAEATSLAATAPPQSKNALLAIAKTAKDGKTKLLALRG
ncbi:hypothetical protein [Fimbriiglobus ruber]|uniref:Zinc-finger domain-containing protein n=1 Tax=Fimbriiglobus ruber TaxID=1908690 RepID=A0A225DAI3_9BACT|nr:hypothetical protein [Fimbriiglobus ruber]OWK37973.1 hypothetical protein FRUB_07093 [Fimbriiglobus ruber]